METQPKKFLFSPKMCVRAITAKSGLACSGTVTLANLHETATLTVDADDVRAFAVGEVVDIETTGAPLEKERPARDAVAPGINAQPNQEPKRRAAAAVLTVDLNADEVLWLAMAVAVVPTPPGFKEKLDRICREDLERKASRAFRENTAISPA